eukprot:SAG31_NODE_6073_length_2182_cov_2.104657_1_plen_144_part_01
MMRSSLGRFAKQGSLLRAQQPKTGGGGLSTALKSRAFSGDVGYGAHCFKGAVAGKYLAAHGLDASVLDDSSWTETSADGVAAAVLDWARDHGASNITHWWQPMGASGVRPGHTGQVHNRMFSFGDDGSQKWELKGKDLIQGETD